MSRTPMRVPRLCPRLAAVALALAVGAWATAPRAQSGLPAWLSDADFWTLVVQMSEGDGFFPSDNLVSNEDTFQLIVPELQRVVKPGGVYVGVGPDQNFTYVANLKPAIAFIPDIRRGNLHMHLMYKALMEQSADRADFLARLFSRQRPAGLEASTPTDELFRAFGQVAPSRALFEQTRAAVLTTLREDHGFGLTEGDEAGIEYILGSFYGAGPRLSYSSAPAGRGSRYPSFAELQTATDADGVARAYLATEEHYRTVRALQRQNLIVPLVGNFAGDRTLRAIAGWVRQRGARVTTFYTSNVEQYLFRDGLWPAFAANVAAMPLDASSTIIRSCFNTCVSPIGNSRVVMLLDSMTAMVADHQAGRITSYYDVLARRR